MFKKCITLSLIFIICLFVISSVSATDDSIITENSDLISSDDSLNINSHSNLDLNSDLTDSNLDNINSNSEISLTKSSSNTLKDTDVGNFTELYELLLEDGNELNLTKDYKRLAEDNVADSGLAFYKTLTINGNGHTLDASNLGRILDVRGFEVILKDITFINGNYSDGGALTFTPHTGSKDDHLLCLSIINCTFINNTAERGGAIFSNGSGKSYNDFWIDNSTFINNSANEGGAIYASYWWSNFTNSEFINNTADGKGGALVVGGSTTRSYNLTYINNSATNGGAIASDGGFFYTNESNFINNSAGNKGGAIYAPSTDLYVNGDNYTANEAEVSGGAIFIEGKGTYLKVNGSSFVNNSCNYYPSEYSSYARDGGGAICSQLNWTGRHTISNSSFINNSAGYYGGALVLSGSNNDYYYILNSTFDNNSAADFGAVVIFTRFSRIDGSNFTNNHANESGGAVGIFNYFDNITNSYFENNSANRYGGAVFSFSPYYHTNIMNNDTFINNSAGVYGGAVNAISTDISDSTFINNSAGDYGAAVTAYGSNVEDSTFENNDAADGTTITMIDGSDINRASSAQNNNGLSEDDVNTDYTDRGIISPMTGYPANVAWSDLGYIGFCCEKFYSQPYSGVVDHSLNVLTNNLNGEVVSEYLKILMFTFFNSTNDLYNNPFHDYVWEFTDYEYWNSNLTVVQEVIRLYDSGLRVPNENALKTLANGNILRMDFLALDTPDGEQDIFLFNWDTIDAELIKETLNETVFMGDDVEFRITVKNTGDALLSNVTVIDNDFSDELKFINYRVESGNWNYNEENNTWTLESLTSNDNASIVLVFRTSINGTFYNNASLILKNYTLDNVTNSTLVLVPDMYVEKIALNDTVYNGNIAEFIIRVNNTGTSNLTNITIREDSYEGLTYVNYKNKTGNWTFDGEDTFTYLGTLSPEEFAEIIVLFNTTKSGNFTNIAIVSSNETNESKRYDTVEVFSPSLDVIKSAEDEFVYIGNSTSFTITVNNTGDCDLDNVTIVEQIPEGLTFVSYENGTGNWIKEDNKFVLDGVLSVGNSVTLIVVFNTTKSGNLINIVVVSSNQTDDKEDNDTVTVLAPSLETTKVANDDYVYLGNTTNFTITVSNTGNCDLDNVTVEEIIPDGLVYISYENGTGNWINKDNIFVLDGILSPNDSVTLIILFNTTRSGNFTNVVVVSSNQTDDKEDNGTVEVFSPSLEVSKIVDDDYVYSGNSTSFTVTVSNTGDCVLDNVAVVEQIPDGLTFVSYENGTGNWIKDGNNFVLVGTLAPNDSVTLVVVFNTTKSGNFTNVVVVSSDLTGNETANDTVKVYTPSLEIYKTTSSYIVYVGDTITYTITVENTGDCDIEGFYFLENLPSALEYLSYENVKGNWTYDGNYLWTYEGSLKVNETGVVDLIFKVVEDGDILNSINSGSELVKNRTSLSTLVTSYYHLTPTKVTLNNTVYLSEQVQFEIIVTNTGEIDASNFTVVEDYPEALVYNSYIDNENLWTKNANNWTYNGVLEPGKSTSFIIVFDTIQTGNFTNNIQVISTENITYSASNTTEVIEKVVPSDNETNNTETNDTETNDTVTNETIPSNDTYIIVNNTDVGNDTDVLDNSTEDNNSFTDIEKVETVNTKGINAGNPLFTLLLVLCILGLRPFRRK